MREIATTGRQPRRIGVPSLRDAWGRLAGFFWRINASPLREVHGADLELLFRSTYD